MTPTPPPRQPAPSPRHQPPDDPPRARETSHVLDRLECLYFLSVYSIACATYIQREHHFERSYQTDALQQGEADAAHAFGHALSVVIRNVLVPRLAPTFSYSLIHDDSTFTDSPFAPLESESAALTLEASPLALAVREYADVLKAVLRCVLAAHKTTLLQSPLP